MSITALRLPDVRSYRFITPNAPDAPQLAREHVAWLLRHARSPVPVDVAKLLVSEVVTNTYQHTTASRISLTTTIQPSRIHVEVYESDPRPLPAPSTSPSPCLAADHGRGLLMLQLLAARWDWELCGGEQPFGKAIWFELLNRPQGQGVGAERQRRH